MRPATAGTVLVYEFVETLNAIRFLMLLRVVGGVLYLAGFLLMVYNLWQTIRSGQAGERNARGRASSTPAAGPHGAGARPSSTIPSIYCGLGLAAHAARGSSCRPTRTSVALAWAGVVCRARGDEHSRARGKAWVALV